MNSLGLGFSHLYDIGRDRGLSVIGSLQWAWNHRNWQPDHSESQAEMAWRWSLYYADRHLNAALDFGSQAAIDRALAEREAVIARMPTYE